jgi:hypothetical protein
MLNKVDNLLAYSAPVPLLYLACVGVRPFVDFEDRSDVSCAHNLGALAKELRIQ